MAESITDHHVEIRQSIKLIHRRSVRRYFEKFFTELALNVGTLCKPVQVPQRSCACGFMTSDDESILKPIRMGVQGIYSRRDL